MTHSPAILYPVFALALWTTLILLCIPIARVRAVRRGLAVVNDFKYGEAASFPAEAGLFNRNYMNLLELPVLFYVVCLLIYVAVPTYTAMVSVAWVYVVCRIVHSLIHVSYNRVPHRLAAFIASNVVLVILWVQAGLGLS